MRDCIPHAEIYSGEHNDRGVSPVYIYGGHVNESDVNALVERARRREKAALNELCSHFYPKVLGYMHHRVGPRFAEDMTEEVFLRVVRSIAGQKGSFVAWLYRIAANVAVDHGRSQAVRSEGPLGDAAAERPAGGDPAHEVGRALDLHQAISRLTNEQRELVTLKFFQGLSTAEVSEATGRTPEAIRALQFRALASLRRALGGEGE